MGLARIFRAESGRILAALISYCKDLELAEDALQEAYVEALVQWKSEKMPINKGGWLFTVAKRKLIDRIRKQKLHISQQTIQRIIDSQPETLEDEFNQPIPDERLKLIFICCHPALKQEAQVALTLKALCGLKVNEIARAFLTSETTMGQRITRAKKKIKLAGIPYSVPDNLDLNERLQSVLSVIYLIFNEAYSAHEGQALSRKDLANEAIRLSRVLLLLQPTAEAQGLLALMLFHHSRRKARTTSTNPLITLEHQDHSLWDEELIEEADTNLQQAILKNSPGCYQIQAAISGLHSTAESWLEVDWKQIILLYQSLNRMQPSPVVELNLLVAIAHSGNLREALRGINRLSDSLKNYQPFYAARAYLHYKIKDYRMALLDFEQAISMTKNSAERDYLVGERSKMERLTGSC